MRAAQQEGKLVAATSNSFTRASELMQTASTQCTGAAATAVTADGSVEGTCTGTDQISPAVLGCMAKEVAAAVAPKVSHLVMHTNIATYNSSKHVHMLEVLLLILARVSSSNQLVHKHCLHFVTSKACTT
jgi:hypothetical protein